MSILTLIGVLVLWGPSGIRTARRSLLRAPRRAAPDGAQPVGGSSNPASEEMREYHERWSYRLIRVGSTWMFGSGN